MSLWLSLCLHVSVCLASVLLESVKQTHPLRSSLLLQIENTFVLCFHQETSESRARDSVTEAGETLQCEREILLFILLVSHVPSVFVTESHISLLQVRHALVNTCRSSDAPHWSDFRR